MRLYLVDCTPLADAKNMERALSLLSDSRREKAKKLCCAQKMAQSVAAGLILTKLFGNEEICIGEHGKPYLQNEDIHFNISHAENWVVCAVSDCEVGLDIQPLSPVRPAVLRRCFMLKEQEWIGNNAERFTRLWTMKEAYMKLTGTGLSVPAQEIEISLPPATGYDSLNNCYWDFPATPIPCAICTSVEKTTELITIEIKDLL